MTNASRLTFVAGAAFLLGFAFYHPGIPVDPSGFGLALLGALVCVVMAVVPWRKEG